MVRQTKGMQSSGHSDLLNFHFSSPVPQQNVPSRTSQSGRQNNRNRHKSGQQYKRTKEDRASARKKASSRMFILHSSPDHAFVISRIPLRNQAHSFDGSDEAVAWETVLVVKVLSSVDIGGETCSICLDSPVCPRITKCGHVYCLTCILHHVQVFHQVHPYAESGPSCPCCSIPLHLGDLRPIEFVSVSPISLGQHVTLQKLHRCKSCPSPFLPLPSEPRRESPHAAPCQTDNDAPYSRFNFVDPIIYHSLLEHNLREVETMHVNVDNHVEISCHQLGKEHVQGELAVSSSTRDQEYELMERFSSSNSGVYTKHPEQLMKSFHDNIQEGLRVMTATDDKHEGQPAPNEECRDRGNSIVSQDETVDSQQLASRRVKVDAASMFLNDGESAFYQSQDGKLCFLSGFNMSCLKADFSPFVPPMDAHCLDLKQRRPHSAMPLPDVVHGNIVEIERVHLTPEARQRLRFLSHVPHYCDITFVEISLTILSQETRKKFAKQIGKRKTARQKQVKAEKRADQRCKQIEQARVNELKSRFQGIDPEDEFFRVLQTTEDSINLPLMGEDFGPSICGDANFQPSAADPSLSFSAITRTSGAYPALASDDTSFPSLGSQDVSRNPGNSRDIARLEPINPKPTKCKKGRTKKVLFSSGGSHTY